MPKDPFSFNYVGLHGLVGSYRLGINALIGARKPYDFLLFPDERHMPRKLVDRVYMEERIRDYFVQHL